MLSQLQALDGAFLLWLQSLRTDALDLIFSWYTSLGNAGFIWIVCSLILLFRRPTRRAGAAALIAMVLGLIFTNLILKQLVARPRPWLDVLGLLPLVEEGDPNSFPSGHTCAAFAAAIAWLGGLPREKIWLGRGGLILAVCMGFSRLYVGVHYPSDVLTGAVIGILCGILGLKFLDFLAGKSKN